MKKSLDWMIFDQLHTTLREADSQRFRELLRSSPLELWELHDDKACTCKEESVFHSLSSCFFREDRLTEFSSILIEYCYYKYAQDAPRVLKQTLSMRELQSRTALMFAVQSNQKVTWTQAYVKLLVEVGASPADVDSAGLSVVHFAAMLDHAALLAYFYKELKLSVVNVDFKGRTPLHLAALDGSYHTADLLIAWGSPITLQDSLGNTPLHLASLNSQSSNYRIVRHLLLRGASRSSVNKAGKTAYDVASEACNSSIAEALVRTSQQPPSCLSACSPCSTRLAPPRCKLKAFVLLHFIQIFRNGVIANFVLPGVV
jgi:hypothetical protein